MIALLQRVRRAHVDVEGRTVAAIGQGLLAFVCAERGDAAAYAERLLERVLNYRVFADSEGKMNLSVRDIGGGLLLVPQFTLAAGTRKGNRPSFTPAAAPEEGKRLFDHAVAYARSAHPIVECGRFGADMQVTLTNDGPVTLSLRYPFSASRSETE
ncbi:MAG TPA: D-aminoacyl-tRNA deacylase [Burkholderiales bacterium]|nr:D-aminoacyl-tRNA deacylase [Burkholderiales bacterium]